MAMAAISGGCVAYLKASQRIKHKVSGGIMAAASMAAAARWQRNAIMAQQWHTWRRHHGAWHGEMAHQRHHGVMA